MWCGARRVEKSRVGPDGGGAQPGSSWVPMSSFVTFEVDSELEEPCSSPLPVLAEQPQPQCSPETGWLGWEIQAVDPLGYRGGAEEVPGSDLLSVEAL